MPSAHHLDLDGFKPVNDRNGHNAGDKLFIELAERMVGSLRQTDTVARIGGD
ncbi:MAG: diguanylate cyclase [Acidimicrobiaceae bacterium]|nr:diguanylate cyclase [Acidimicrobiaceae bacterium]